MTYTTGNVNNDDKKPVQVQERTFRIVKNFIRCATCVRNLDMEKMHTGYYVKNYCNFHKEKLKSCYDPDYDIDADREKAQQCPYYLPESLTVAADLSDLQPYEIKNSEFLVKADHAEGLEMLFASKKNN